jgi:hypothetical protein
VAANPLEEIRQCFFNIRLDNSVYVFGTVRSAGLRDSGCTAEGQDTRMNDVGMGNSWASLRLLHTPYVVVHWHHLCERIYYISLM